MSGPLGGPGTVCRLVQTTPTMLSEETRRRRVKGAQGGDARPSGVQELMRRFRSPPVALTSGCTCLVRREALADWLFARGKEGSRQACLPRRKGPLGGPHRTAQRRAAGSPCGRPPEARRTARQVQHGHDACIRAAVPTARRMCGSHPRSSNRVGGKVPTHRSSATRPARLMRGARCGGRKALADRHRHRQVGSTGASGTGREPDRMQYPLYERCTDAALVVPRSTPGRSVARMEGIRDDGREVPGRGSPGEPRASFARNGGKQVTDTSTEQSLEDGGSRDAGCTPQRQEGIGRR